MGLGKFLKQFLDPKVTHVLGKSLTGLLMVNAFIMLSFFIPKILGNTDIKYPTTFTMHLYLVILIYQCYCILDNSKIEVKYEAKMNKKLKKNKSPQ